VACNDRHRARQGQISILSGAPYGYRYVRKSDETAAFYQIIEAEADVVRLVYERYTAEHLSIGAITRLLNKQGVPTRMRISRWERSTVSGTQLESSAGYPLDDSRLGSDRLVGLAKS